jgi:hypothetical protein
MRTPIPHIFLQISKKHPKSYFFEYLIFRPTFEKTSISAIYHPKSLIFRAFLYVNRPCEPQNPICEPYFTLFPPQNRYFLRRYIIGGIVDRNRNKGVSWERAGGLGVETARFCGLFVYGLGYCQVATASDTAVATLLLPLLLPHCCATATLPLLLPHCCCCHCHSVIATLLLLPLPQL